MTRHSRHSNKHVAVGTLRELLADFLGWCLGVSWPATFCFCMFLYCESRAKQGDAKPVKNISFSMKRVESTEHIKPVRFVRQKHLHLTNSAAVILGVGLDCTGGDPDLCCQEHGNVQLCHAKLRNLSGLA